MKKDDKVLVQGTFDGYDPDGNALVSFLAVGGEVTWYPQVAVVQEHVRVVPKIDSFSGEYEFLSNFSVAIVTLDGMEYATVEHAYQAAKTLDPDKRQAMSLRFNPDLSPAQAKRIGRSIKIRPDWEDIKIGVMWNLLVQKFSKPPRWYQLLATGDAELIEGNWWHDQFWGVCMGSERCAYGPHEPKGENHLGKLLMEIRKTLAFGKSSIKLGL